MKRSHKLLSFALVAAIATGTYSCTDNYDEINTNKTKLTELDGSAIGNAFAAAQYRSIQASWQTYQSLFADLQGQYFANIAQNFSSDRNVMVGNWLNGAWSGFYGTAIPPLLGVLDATKPGGPNENPAQYAIANIWKVYMYLPRTDYWGPIPYSEVGNGLSSVKYDTQEAIYKDFVKTLAESTAALGAFKGTNVYANNDQIYAGSVDKWILFANTLRLRIAMRMSKVEPALAKTEAEAAVAGGTLASNADDAFLKVTANSFNPMNQATAWNEFRMSAAMESVLKGYADPRISKFYAPVPGTTNTFKGLRNGYTQGQLGADENNANKTSNVADAFLPAVQQTNPFAIMYASEAYFLKAEGALKGWNMGGTAKDMYEKGIETAMKQWGIADAAAITAYINGTTTPIALNDMVKTPALTNVPVKFSADASKQLEQIITQKWLANYPNGHEAWAEYRRTGFPKLYARVNSDNPDSPADAVVRRTPFVTGEYQSNKVAVDAAVGLLGGPDKSSTRLWWDKP
ncbi:SusD/RagB family nutrient-binding outer membrane lipoprotein [Dyadobacter psychrophilus]|uniref:Susd and RagB outer membrane lipoprotein n=1 Tax=Dyadobacter psychrophilus TaxID=651661 RepID=A0A1T5C6X0_9BACT|nr:SusD/RagB family nutrient-binding outer membrane lipoprotein [Dyadobacter psychrophilus]SKB55099.1 Susd and RagB outer membrane lipoprotein [Dyadobacter psychrophilus]